ncbi:acyl-CoA thioesterase II [Altererythrobacter sp. ZODW24]|uniref:acyl-CoA thioesterase n=1 Tax=Altererythrobacter sp. ZODW24 TaxID=2185142 RepID=UPI000DF7FF4C|nr:acyl-CoA thioesterase II [Altererythrobacter sp. ZODW24]
MATDPLSEKLVAGLLRLLDVTQTGEDEFTGRHKKNGVGRVFGGQVIAQALLAAEKTVPEDRAAHSLHAYFLRGGSEGFDVDYSVDRQFDGGSFCNRRVVAAQQGRPILNVAASFQRHEEGLHHQAEGLPDVPGPDDLPSEAEERIRLAKELPEDKAAFFLQPRPIESRAVEGRHWNSSEPAAPISHSWIRASAPLPDDPRIHRAILAYASDMQLLGTSMLPHGLSWARNEIYGASLDHTVWFHEPFRADEWMLYQSDSPWTGRGRGFNRGRILSADGRLIASVAQEGMVRQKKQLAD